MTTNTENMEKMNALIERLDAAFKATYMHDTIKATPLMLARDAAIKARAAARAGDNDLCGRFLETARAYMQEARA